MGRPLTTFTWVANWSLDRDVSLSANVFVCTGSFIGQYFVAPDG
jgi:2-keto-4-pentenoate hydratase